MTTMKTLLAGLAMAFTAFAHGADLEAGKASYGTCAACHGGDAQGNPALNAPALAGQSADYLARQIGHYQAGIRGADARDTLGRQMQGMAATLASPEAVANVAA